MLPTGSRRAQRLLVIERQGERSSAREIGACSTTPLIGAEGFSGWGLGVSPAVAGLHWPAP